MNEQIYERTLGVVCVVVAAVILMLVLFTGCQQVSTAPDVPLSAPELSALRYSINTDDADGIMPDTVKFFLASDSTPWHYSLKMFALGDTTLKQGVFYESGAIAFTVVYTDVTDTGAFMHAWFKFDSILIEWRAGE